MRRTITVSAAILALGTVLAIAIAGCGGGGAKVSTDTKPAKISEILDDPGGYEGRGVVIEGVLAYFCCADGFTMKDGVSGMKVIISETAPMPEQSKLNSRLMVEGNVVLQGGIPAVSAQAIEFL